MKAFTKGTLTTIVDDDDRRIPEYLASGWKAAPLPEKTEDDVDNRIDKAMQEANESENTGKDKGKGKRKTAPDKKINDAVEASANAVAESDAVDDGLIKSEVDNG